MTAKKRPKDSDKSTKDSPKGKAPRPDQMSPETFAFIAAIDARKRIAEKSFLTPEEVLDVLRGMGYQRPPRKRDALREYERALDKYRKEHGRLFPNWSEVFEVIVGLGYKPAEAA